MSFSWGAVTTRHARLVGLASEVGLANGVGLLSEQRDRAPAGSSATSRRPARTSGW